MRGGEGVPIGARRWWLAWAGPVSWLRRLLLGGYSMREGEGVPSGACRWRLARAGLASWWRCVVPGAVGRRRGVRGVGRAWGEGVRSCLASVAASAWLRAGSGRVSGRAFGVSSARARVVCGRVVCARDCAAAPRVRLLRGVAARGTAARTAWFCGGCGVARRCAGRTCAWARESAVLARCTSAACVRVCVRVLRLDCACYRGARLWRVPGGDAG